MLRATRQVGRLVHPQRELLGQEGAAVAAPSSPSTTPQTPQILALTGGQIDVVGQFSVSGGAAAADRQLQHHQAEVQRAPPAVHAQRQGPVHRRAGAPGDRAHAWTGRAIVTALFKGLADVGNDSPFAPVFPSTNTSRRRSARRTSPRPSRCWPRPAMPNGFSTQLVTEQRRQEIPNYAQIVAQSAKAIGVNHQPQDGGAADLLRQVHLRQLGLARRRP